MALSEQQGQVLIIVALAMIAMLGVGGFVIDLGRFYVVRSQLQNSVNAAGLAAAGDIYNTGSLTSATTEATNFANNDNSISGLTENAGYPLVQTPCLNMLLPSGSPACTNTSGSASGTSVANAVRVTEQVKMPTWFMGLFGVKTLVAQATATASMQGIAQRWNVAIIVDETGTMSQTDNNCSATKIQCALQGIQSLLTKTQPCNVGGSSCIPSTSNFRVALFSFPNMDTTKLSMAVGASCAASSATTSTGGYPAQATGVSPYTPAPWQVSTLPKETAQSYTPLVYDMTVNSVKTTWSASYEFTYPVSGSPSDVDANGFLSDYFDPSSTSTGGLNASSSIVRAVGYGSGTQTGCLSPSTMSLALNNDGIKGGNITYYASVIYAAQAALVAEQNLHPDAQNAIIILGDGGEYSLKKYFPPSTCTPTSTTCYQKTSSITYVPSTIDSSSSGYSLLTGTGKYPDFNDQCQQSIVAAQAAKAAGTRVYSVAYGADTPSTAGCVNDSTSLGLTGLNVPISIPPTPCQTMQNIASSLDYFYSDYNQTGASTGCVDSLHSITSLKNIFAAVAATFTQPRLLPNNAT